MSFRITPRVPLAALAGCVLALASPALADQFKQSADGGTIACSVSARELTRFALIGDQFASVSKISSGYPYNDFAVTHEPVRGDTGGNCARCAIGNLTIPPKAVSSVTSLWASNSMKP